MWVLERLERTKELVERTKSKLGPHDREIARVIMQEHMARLSEASTDADRKAKTRSFLKPLRERQAVLGEAEPLEVAAAERKQTTFHAWLSEDPESVERGDRDLEDELLRCRGLVT